MQLCSEGVSRIFPQFSSNQHLLSSHRHRPKGEVIGIDDDQFQEEQLKKELPPD